MKSCYNFIEAIHFQSYVKRKGRTMTTASRSAASLIFLISCFPAVTPAQVGSMPEALFGAHGLSLGRSAVISAHEALSASWNPAGITTFKRIIASAAFINSPVADAAHSSFGIVIPTKRYGNFGVSFFHIGIGFVARDENGSIIGDASAQHNHLLLTYGRHLSKAISIGLNVKFVEQKLIGKSATLENPGIDFGMFYRLPSSPELFRNLVLGIAIDNFAKPSLKFGQVRDALPREARFIAEKAITMGDGQLTLVSNWAYREYYFHQNKTAWHGGVEYSYKSTVALRAGVNESLFSAGIGLQYKGLIIDYAHIRSPSASEAFSPATSALSLTYQF
jgi:hypothetical protein